MVAAATGAVFTVGGVTALPGQTDPIGDAERAVAAAEAEADRAADQYFEQLAKFETLEVEIADTERHLRELDARVDTLREQVEERALLAYVRSGDSQVEFGFAEEEQAFAAARRTELLEKLNQSDADAATELARVTSALEAERSRLAAEKQAQEDALAALRAEQESLDAKLAEAQARRRSLATPPPPPSAGGGTAAPAPQPASATPSAPTPPPDYTPTAGEHPQHNHPFLVCTREIESGGNYQAYNGAGPYLGAYQFLQSTWNSTANHTGRSELVGVDPRNASEYDQDDMAWTLYNWQGKGPWGGRC